MNTIGTDFGTTKATTSPGTLKSVGECFKQELECRHSFQHGYPVWFGTFSPDAKLILQEVTTTLQNSETFPVI